MMGGGGMQGGMAGGGGMMGGAPGGTPGGGGGAPGGMVQFSMGPGGAAGGAGNRGAGGPGGGAGLSDEQRTKMREAMQKALGGKNMQDLTQEERTEVFAKVQAELAKAGVTMPSRGGTKSGDSKAGDSKGGERKSGEAAEGRQPGEGRGNREGGEPAAGADASRGARGQGGGGRGQGGAGQAGGMMMASGGFSAKELADAKLPPPPEEDDQLDVLLRPGLLADVEIIVENIPNAIHVPMQAIFERDGKSIVYVKQGQKLVARVVKPLKRSESTMVISEGLKPGEEVALVDPDAKPSDKKGAKKGGDNGGAPAGGGGMPMGMGGKKGG